MRLKIYLVLAVALFAVSTSSIIARFLPSVPAVVIAFWRLAIASTVLWVYSSIKKQGRTTESHYKYYLLSGLFLACHFASFYAAVKLTSIANATLLGITAPLFTILYERFVLKRHLKPVVFIGFVLAATGTVIVVGFDSLILQQGGASIGKLLGLFAAMFISLVYIIANRLREHANTIVYTRLLYSFAAIFLLLLSILYYPDFLFRLDVRQAGFLLGLGIVPTILGHSLLYYAIKFTSPTIVASIPIGEPIIASLFARFFFFETVTVPTIVGGILIIVGIYFLVVFSPKNIIGS